MTEAAPLTQDEIAGLRWMSYVNPKIGFLWDYCRKHGPIAEYRRLVAEGYANYVPSHWEREKCGYWILPKGREAATTMNQRETCR